MDRARSYGDTGRRRPAASAKARHLLPRLPGVAGPEQRGVFHAGVDGVRIRQRRFDVPDALEFPRVRRAVVPLMGSRHGGVLELVANRLPRFAAVIRALHDLPEPPAGLRCVQTVRIRRRCFQVVQLPAAEMRLADRPFVALPVRRHDERAFARPDQKPYTAHQSPLPDVDVPPIVDRRGPESTHHRGMIAAPAASQQGGQNADLVSDGAATPGYRAQTDAGTGTQAPECVRRPVGGGRPD